MKKPVDVYLAGGTKSGWQNQLKRALNKLHQQGLVRWSNPEDNRTRNPEEIGLLNEIRRRNTDIIFLNEQDPGSNIGCLHQEIEKAKSLGKITVLLTVSKNSFIDSENLLFCTEKWHLAVNMLEEMIWAIAEDK